MVARTRWAIAWTLLAGCGAPPSTDVTSDVVIGDLAGEDVSIAVVAKGDRVMAFVCADDPEGDAYPGWLGGDVTAGGEFRVTRDGWTLAGHLEPDGASGTLVDPEGETDAWTAIAPLEPGSGLYAAADHGCLTGVIVLDPTPADAPLVRGAWCSGDGEIRQVTPLLPLEVDGEGHVAVQVELEGDMHTFEVAPVRLPPR